MLDGSRDCASVRRTPHRKGRTKRKSRTESAASQRRHELSPSHVSANKPQRLSLHRDTIITSLIAHARGIVTQLDEFMSPNCNSRDSDL